MANPPKKKGTEREVRTVERVKQWPGLDALRAPNNAPSWDVSARAEGLGTFRIEVKDRQQLNAHRVVKDATAANAGIPVVLVWHRTSKKDGAKRASADGPTLAMLDQDIFYALLSMASLLTRASTFRDHPGVVEQMFDDAGEVLDRLDERFPYWRNGGF